MTNVHPTLLSRLVREGDWTAEEVCAAFERAAREMGESATLSVRQLGRWMDGEVDQPRKTSRRVAEKLWQHPFEVLVGPAEGSLTTVAVPDQVHLTSDDSEEGGLTDRRQAIRVLTGSALLAAGLGGTADPAASPADDSVTSLRSRLDQALGAGASDPSLVAHWGDIAESFGRTYRVTPSQAFLERATREVSNLHGILSRPLPGAQRRGLCHCAAHLCGLIATSLVNLNAESEARAWFLTASRAADESEDDALRGWVMVRHAVSALYWNDPYHSLKLATRAAAITSNIPCVAAAWAPAVQARAYSRLGDRYVEATRNAIGRAEDAFVEMRADLEEQFAYGYSAAQLNFYRSNALTEIGDTASAYQAQATALQHYDASAFLDPSLIRLDRAICLLKDGEAENAALVALKLLADLPEEHRAPIILRKAQALALAIPDPQRHLQPVQELHWRLSGRTVEAIDASGS